MDSILIIAVNVNHNAYRSCDMQREEFVEYFKTHLHIFRMHSITIILVLCGLLGSSLALTCWNSVGFKALRDTNVREINS